MPVKIDGGGYINSPYLGTANNIYTDGTGKVGIGTTSPTNLLEVAGSAANIYLRSNDSGDATLRYMGASSERATVRASSGNALYMETGGIERLRIDASGRVTMPYQPFSHYTHADDSVKTTTGFPVKFTIKLTGRGTDGYSTSTGLYTAPVSGVYSFTWAYLYANVLTTARVDDGYQINGTNYYGGNRYTGSGYWGDGYIGVKGAITVYITAGDTFAPRSNLSDDASFNIYSEGSWGYFTAALIG